jgi:hypothetical protein
MTVFPHDLDAVLADLRSAVAAEARSRSLPWWRRRAALLALVPVALALGAGAYAVARTTAERVADDIACHDRPTLRSSIGVVEADGRDPTVVCAEAMWRGRAAPPLVACADPEDGGEVEVFPSETTAICERLGLAQLPPGYAEAAVRFAAFRADVAARFLGSRCVSEAEGRDVLRAALDRHGLGDWKIATLGFSPSRPCATLWFDTVHAVAGITGGPGEKSAAQGPTR